MTRLTFVPRARFAPGPRALLEHPPDACLAANRRRRVSIEIGRGDGSDARRALPRARSRTLLVGARPARARADEARSPAAPVPREVRPAARRGAVRAAPSAGAERARSLRGVGHR